MKLLAYGRNILTTKITVWSKKLKQKIYKMCLNDIYKQIKILYSYKMIENKEICIMILYS